MGHDHDRSFCSINLLKGERKIVREWTRKPWFFCSIFSYTSRVPTIRLP